MVRNLLLSLALIGPSLGLLGQKIDKQSNDENERPKLAIVLSGGGAKGVAHIPLLQLLDSMNVVPDLIVGTSMGSVIGGLYAMGYSADTLEQIVKNINWDQLLSNRVQYNYLNPAERDEAEKYSVNLPFDETGVGLPSGLIESQELSLFFRRMAQPVADVYDFDDLPIPYRSITTDILNGEKVVFENGDIVVAMRASMAIPTVFTPVEYKDHVLVDGGVLDNFPVEIARELGADIVIGSDVTGGLQPREALNSMINVIVQSTVIASASINERNRNLCDLLLDHVPNLSYNTGDFSKASDIYQEGIIAKRQNQTQLINLLEPFSGINERNVIRSNSDFSFDSIQFKGLSDQNQKLIARKFDVNQSSTNGVNELENKMRFSKGSRLFEKMSYQFETLNDKNVLTINAKEEKKGSIQGSVHYDTEDGAGIMINTTVRDLIGKRSRTLATVDAAENPKFRLQHQQYFKNPKWWYRIEYHYEDLHFTDYNEGVFAERFEIIFWDYFFRLNRDISNNATFKVEFNHGQNLLKPEISYETQNISRDTLSDGVERYINRFNFIGVQYCFNDLNRRYYPDSGHNLEIETRLGLTNDAKYNYYSNVRDNVHSDLESTLVTKLKYFGNFSLRDRVTLQLDAFAGFQFAKNDSLFFTYGLLETFLTGGIDVRPNPMYVTFDGLRNAEIASFQLMKASLNLQMEVKKNLYVIPTLNIASFGSNDFDSFIEGFGEFNFNWSEEETQTTFAYSAGLTVAYMAPIGPIQVNLALPNDINTLRAYFTFGYTFH